MSLLLDALKKAAQQKAEKSREDIPEAETSDETIVVSAPEDISELEAAEEVLPSSQRELGDETELDASVLQTQLEDTQLEDTRLERSADETGLKTPDPTETGLEIPDSTETRQADLSTQMQTGEDETIVFAEEDVSDFLGEPELVNRDVQDETDLSQLAQPDDRTDLSKASRQADEADIEDETDLSQLAQPDDRTDLSKASPQADVADTVDETDLSQSTPEVTQAAGDEDMSLLLVEGDDTTFTARTSLTDTQPPQNQAEIVESGDGESDELGLIDTTRHNLPGEATETQSATQTSSTGITLDNQSTATRTDSTGTYTYAPDNYDRTLMKVPSDDASKLFAGMKNDSDAVMTPDYAKKVFRSKSSAQRMGSYKIYAGTAVVIILAIGIFGAFEFQDESNNIDTSLRPLKRDPMPGLIRKGGQEQEVVQAATGIDQRTIEIIESAGSETSEGEVIIESSEVELAAVEVEPEITTVEPEPVGMTAGAVPADTAQTEKSTEVAIVVESEASALEPESSSTNLQIVTTSRVGQKDIRLREAYDAYKSGNDELAMTRYNQVLEEDPGNRNALLARAAINVQNGDSAAAIKDYQAILLANPKDSLAMASLIAVANYSPRDSESQLKLMIRDEPSSPYLNFALANVYGAQNRWQEAQGYYFRALQNNPQDPNYAYNLAISLEHISQPGSAISYYQRALENFENGPATFSRDVVDQRLELLAKK
jgi:Tfp pilus assembly protein PilF